MKKAERSIEATEMHGCVATDASGILLREITLLPFFDEHGVIQTWLMVQPEMGLIWFLEGQFLEDHGGFVYQGHWGHPAPPTPRELKRFAALFHYDPWWLLKLPPFAEEEWVPALKATNVAERSECEDLAFSGKLERTQLELDLARETAPQAT